MEDDSIRASGSNTLVDIWVGGKLRGIVVSREAIESFLGRQGKRPPAMSDDDRCDFVRKNLSLVVSAVNERLREIGPTEEVIVISGEQLWKRDGGGLTDRRKGERRKVERRSPARAAAPPPKERRRTERRKAERRGPKESSES